MRILRRFVAVGAFATAVDFGGFLVLHLALGWSPLVADVVAIAAATVTSFVLHRVVTFAADQEFRSGANQTIDAECPASGERGGQSVQEVPRIKWPFARHHDIAGEHNLVEFTGVDSSDGLGDACLPLPDLAAGDIGTHVAWSWRSRCRCDVDINGLAIGRHHRQPGFAIPHPDNNIRNHQHTAAGA